jgi:hypothetical protein
MALLLPSRNLPPEILSQIFLEHLIGCQGGGVFPARKDVLSTTQICRYWRDVAISSPKLWSALCFDLRMRNTDRELEMGPIWLARSGDTPLTLGITNYSDGLQTHPITDMILPNAPRLYSLILNTTPFTVYNLRNIKGQIPRLRNLTIQTSHVAPSLLQQSLDTFEIAPQLRSLTLIGKVSVLIPIFPWASLRELHLRVHQYTLRNYLQILRDASNLEVCTIYPWDSRGQLASSIVWNYKMRELNTEGCKELALLFKFLELSSLLHLSCQYFDTWPRDEFLSFMHRSSFSLQKLSLLGNGYNDGHSIAECLRYTTHLLELELLEGSGAAINGKFLHEMTHHASSPSSLLPKLQRLKMTRHTSFDYTAFAAMVESRWRVNPLQGTTHVTVERIQRVEICLMNDYDRYNDYDPLRHHVAYSDSFMRLRQLQAEGLVLISPDIDPDGSNIGQPEGGR